MSYCIYSRRKYMMWMLVAMTKRATKLYMVVTLRGDQLRREGDDRLYKMYEKYTLYCYRENRGARLLHSVK